MDLAGNPAKNVPVWLRPFDVDDPSSPHDTYDDPANPQIDFDDRLHEQSGENADNLLRFDAPYPGQIVEVRTGTPDGTAVRTNDQGIVEVIFEVTRQPGDNFRVVATVKGESELNALGAKRRDRIAGVYYILRRTVSNWITWGSRVPDDADRVPILGVETKVSPVLTVWRRLWVRADSLRQIPQEAIDAERQDTQDEPLQGNVPDPDLKALTVAIRDAYIEVRQLNGNDNLPWRHNFRRADDLNGYLENQGNQTMNLNTNDYWVVYIVGGYEIGPLYFYSFDPVTGQPVEVPAMGGRPVTLRHGWDRQ